MWRIYPGTSRQTDINLVQNRYKSTGGTLLQGIKRLNAGVINSSPSANVTANDRDPKRTAPSTLFPAGNWAFTRRGNTSSSTCPVPCANSEGFSDNMTTVADANLVQNSRALCYGGIDASDTGLKDNEVLPVNFATSNSPDLDNFPNPFTYQTTIRLTVPVKGSASLQSRTTLAATITTLEDPDDYEGIHSLTFMATGLHREYTCIHS